MFLCNSHLRALLKMCDIKNFSLKGTDEWTDERTDEWTVATPIKHRFLNTDMLIILCVKFHYDQTSISLKTTLTKNLILSGTD